MVVRRREWEIERFFHGKSGKKGEAVMEGLRDRGIERWRDGRKYVKYK
jgi:hypothetical protein